MVTPPRESIDRKWWVLVAVGVGTFMSALDASVVNTMLPIIGRSMGTSVATIEWVVTAYLLVVSALGLQAMMTYIGLTTGPALGGSLTHLLGWRSIFYINVPVGIAAMWLSARFVRDAPHPARAERFDFAGGVLFALGLTALLLALNQGHVWGWNSPPVVALLVLSVLALAAFIRVELRARSPMLDLRLFGSRTFSAATGSAVLNYICAYSIVFVLPFYLISGRGFGPARAAGDRGSHDGHRAERGHGARHRARRSGVHIRARAA